MDDAEPTRAAKLAGVEGYQALDLAPEGAIVGELMGRADRELGAVAKTGEIDLTGAQLKFDAKNPCAMTPAMSAWYLSRVAGPRSAAIAEIANGFHNEKVPEGRPRSTFLEMRCDEVRTRSLGDRIKDTEQFLDHNRALIDRFNRGRTEFNTLKASLGREPVRPRPVLYVLALLGLVMLEAFINFESFLKVPYITSPFLATGATLAVAFGIAVSAHYHGVVLRQWAYLFSPQDPSDKSHGSRKSDAIRRLVVGALLLSVALLMVAGSRYYYLREYIVQAQILGSSPPSMFGGIVFMLFGNMVAYLVALMVSYALHDPNPNYSEKDVELKRATRLMEATKARRKAAQVTMKQGEDNALTSERNLAANSRGPGYFDLRRKVDAVIEKDQQVIAALLDYRNRLVQSLGDRNDDRLFRYPGAAYEEVVPVDLDLTLTPRQYASEQILLGFA